MLWGYFKKVVVADRLAIYVNSVYADVHQTTGIPLILATVFFAFQIYCDFSGYSDIAIGVAQIMGFDLMDNFKRPYFSKSIKEFWQRWHISLSTWFKDYVYIPLGGKRVKISRNYLNLFLTFLISGLWHGASWTFVLWGILHGTYQIVGMMTKQTRVKIASWTKIDQFSRLQDFIQICITFTLVNFGWIFFRANSVSDAFYVVKNLFRGVLTQLTDFSVLKDALNGVGIDRKGLFTALFVIGVMECVHLVQRHGSIRHMLRNKPIWLRWGLYYLLVFMILILGVFGQSQFIYFQF